MLCCFHKHNSSQTFHRALTVLVDSCVEIKECPDSGVTSSGRVWRKMPESDAGSVECPLSGVTSSGRVWRKGSRKRVLELERAATPESEHRNVAGTFA